MNWCTLRMSLADADFTANRSNFWPMPNSGMVQSVSRSS